MLKHLRLGMQAAAGVIEIDLVLVVEPPVVTDAQRIERVRGGVLGKFAEELLVRFGHGWSIFNAKETGSVNVPRS